MNLLTDEQQRLHSEGKLLPPEKGQDVFIRNQIASMWNINQREGKNLKETVRECIRQNYPGLEFDEKYIESKYRSARSWFDSKSGRKISRKQQEEKERKRSRSRERYPKKTMYATRKKTEREKPKTNPKNVDIAKKFLRSKKETDRNPEPYQNSQRDLKKHMKKRGDPISTGTAQTLAKKSSTCGLRQKESMTSKDGEDRVRLAGRIYHGHRNGEILKRAASFDFSGNFYVTKDGKQWFYWPADHDPPAWVKQKCIQKYPPCAQFFLMISVEGYYLVFLDEIYDGFNALEDEKNDKKREKKEYHLERKESKIETLKFKLKESKKKFTKKMGRKDFTVRKRKKLFKKFEKERKKLEKVLNSEKILIKDLKKEIVFFT